MKEKETGRRKKKKVGEVFNYLRRRGQLVMGQACRRRMGGRKGCEKVEGNRT